MMTMNICTNFVWSMKIGLHRREGMRTMNWKLLGIEPTKDKKTITAAYRAQLAHTNPEDKPEAFKELRSAYEEALALAEQESAALARDESPVGLWMERIRELYADFARRIQPECWEELLSDDVCMALDTRPLAEEALLNFLMQDFYIPQGVWQTLDRAFSWLERREELRESYRSDFIDYAVLNGIRYPANLPYELFVPGINGNDCDEYRRLYYRTGQSTPTELPPILEQMNQLSERHPYGELLNCSVLMENGKTEQALEGYRVLAESYPRDAKIQLEWAAQCMKMESWAEGESYIRRVLALRPDAAQAKQMLATCLAGQGRYAEAKKLVFRLMDDAGGDQKRISELRQIIQGWNGALIQTLEAQVETEPENMELRVKLAWCYLQNDRDGDALRLCRTIDSGYKDPYDYHNLYAKTAYAMGDYAAAFSHLQETENILKVMEPDGTDETARRIASLPEQLQMQGSCLINLDRSEEAIGKYEQALELAPDNPEVLTHMGRLLCFVGDHSRAAEIFKKLTNILPGAYHGFYLLAQTLFDLGRDREAFEAVNRALDLEGGDLGVYLLQIRILLRNGAWQGARNALDFLRQHGITDEINTVWCEAQLLEQGEGDKEQALARYRTLAARIEDGETLEEASKLYFRLLCLEAEHLDAGKKEDRAKMLELAEKGLAHNENDFPCLDYKAWLLKRDGKREEALEIYHRLEAVPRRSMNVEQELAQLYYKDLNRDADKSLHYYKMLLEQDEQPVYLFYAGTCCKYLEQYEQAEKYFLRMQEITPDDADAYKGMSYLYDTMKRYEESLEQINKTIARIQDWEGDQSSFYYHKSRILRRLNRPEEAAAVIDELTEKYGNKDIYQEKFEIYCQFGLWEQAQQVLKEWRKSGSKKNRLQAAVIDLDLFMGKIDKACAALEKVSKRLNAGDADRLNLLMGELNGDEAVQMAILEKKAVGREDQTHELLNMAQTQWWSGHCDNARQYARKALEQLKELIPVRKRNEALYRSRYAMALALLGRFDEALAELEEVCDLPLCEGCNYCSCKDAEIFRANIEEVRGNWDRALELYRSGAEHWPDDLDFVSGIRRIMRKGQKV